MVYKHEYTHYVGILFLGILLTLPYLLTGLTAGIDSRTHVTYQRGFDEQFWRGNLYPRWLGTLNMGTGSPIFFIQYPLPYFIAAAIGWVSSSSVDEVNQVRILGILASIAVIASALTAYKWLRSCVAPSAALFGAFFYMAAPYHLGVDLYDRAAIGELFAFVWMPLCLFYVVQVLRDSDSSPLGLAAAFAALLMSHAITALLFLPILVFYVLILSTSLRRHLTRLFMGLALAMLLSGAYLVPLIFYSSSFDFQALTGSNFVFSNHFLFIEKSAYWAIMNAVLGPVGRVPLLPEFLILLVSTALVVWWLATLRLLALGTATRLAVRVGCITALGLGFAFVMLFRPAGSGIHDPFFIGNLSFSALSLYVLTLLIGPLALFSRNQRQSMMFLVCGAASLFMMFHASKWLWETLHWAQNIQFPWRLSCFLTLSTTFIVAASRDYVDENKLRKTKLALMVVATSVLIANFAVWEIPRAIANPAPWRELPGRFDMMFPTYARDAELKRPLTESSSAFLKATPEVTVTHLTRTNDRIELKLDASQPSFVRIGQLFFRNWAGRLNDRELPLRASEPEGWLSFNVAKGSHTILLEFKSGWPETAGKISTAIAVLVFVVFLGTKNFKEGVTR